MKPKLILAAIAALALTSCEKDLHEDPDKLARLPESVQIAVVWSRAAGLFAIAAVVWALNSGVLVQKITQVAKGGGK